MPFTVEYVTHGGFEMVRDAWLFVSHIFNQAGYRDLVTAVYLASIIFMAIFSLLQSPLRRQSAYGWMWTALMAVIIWTMFFNTSNFGSWSLDGKVVVYDDIKNKSQDIDDLPPGLVLLAGAINKAQVGLEDMVDTVLSGASVDNTSELVIGVKMLREARKGMLMGALSSVIDIRFSDSLYRYIDDCVATEAMARPELRQKLSNSSDIIGDVFAASNNPALYTLTYLNASGDPQNSAEAVSCKTAWDRLKLYNSKPVWVSATKAFCKNFGFDALGTSYAACRKILTDTVNTLLFNGVSTYTSPEAFARQIYYGAQWKRFIMSLDSSVALAGILSSVRAQSNLIGTGMAAEAWVLHIKIVVETILIAMTPLILLFLASSFSLDALKTLVGLWLFYAFWVVADKIIEGFWVSYAQSTWDQIQAAGIGMASQEQLWLMASKTLAVLGAMRTKGMLFAGVFTYGVFRFGGSALAHLAGGLTASSVGAGGSAAGGAVTPEKTAQKAMATSWMSDTAIAGEVGRQRMDWLYGLGQARVAQQRRTTGLYEKTGIEGAYQAGLQEGRQVMARTRATARFSDSELYYSALASHLRGMGMGKVADGLMQGGLDGTQTGLMLFSGGRVSLGGVDKNVLSGFAREMGLDEGLLSRLAKHTYVSPRFDSKGNISGFNVEMRLAPEEAGLFAKAIKEKNPNVAAKMEGLAAEGRSVAVNFVADDGRIISGEGKTGFKVRALDLAQSETGMDDKFYDRESGDISGEHPYVLWRDGKPVMTLTSGHFRREGDSLVLTNARSDTGAFFHELKATRDGTVQGFRLKADNKRQLLDTIKKLGLFDRFSGKHYSALPKNTPVVASWDGAGKINAGAETTVKDKTTRDSLDRTVSGREGIYKDVNLIDSSKGFSNINAVAAYLYDKPNSTISKIVGKNAWKDQAYNENTLIQTSSYIDEKVDHEGAIFQTLGIGEQLIAKLSSETQRRLKQDLHYGVLSVLDARARDVASVGTTEQERMELYTEMKQKYFHDYTRLMDLYARNPGLVWDDIKEKAQEIGIDQNVVNVFDDIRSREGVLRLVRGAESLYSSAVKEPARKAARKAVELVLGGFLNTKGAEEYANSLFKSSGLSK